MARLGDGIRPRWRRRNGKRELSYQARLRLKKDGRVIRWTETFDTHAEAVQGLADQRARAYGGELGEKLYRQKTLGKITLADLWHDYTWHLLFKTKRSSTRNNELARLREFAKREPELFSKTLDQITKKDFADYRDRRLTGKDRVSPATLRRELNPLRAMFKFGRQERGYDVDPFRGLWLPPEDPPRQPRLSLEEKTRLFKALEAHSFRNKRDILLWHSLILTALTTGLRKGVLLQLKWKDIDWEKRILHIPRSYCTERKNAPPIMPLERGLWFHLHLWRSRVPEERRTPNSLVFPINSNTHETTWRSIVRRAELYEFKKDEDTGEEKKSYLRFHDLRHIAATSWNEIRLNFLEVQYMLGHKGGGITGDYAQVDIENIRNLLDKGFENIELPEDDEELEETVDFLTSGYNDYDEWYAAYKARKADAAKPQSGRQVSETEGQEVSSDEPEPWKPTTLAECFEGPPKGQQPEIDPIWKGIDPDWKREMIEDWEFPASAQDSEGRFIEGLPKNSLEAVFSGWRKKQTRA